MSKIPGKQNKFQTDRPVRLVVSLGTSLLEKLHEHAHQLGTSTRDLMARGCERCALSRRALADWMQRRKEGSK
jgi:hypothetical protein